MFGDHSLPATAKTDCHEGLAQLLDLTREGILAEWATTATQAELHRIRRVIYHVAWPIVFDTVTRSMEQRRGHAACAQGLRNLTAECLDKFHDDVAAVVDGVIRRGTKKVQNLEAWIATIANAATVDGHRRRRGERGALQRPRVPQWLARELAEDEWLLDLAVQIMVWTGLPSTAGVDLWPFDNWAERRAESTGDRKHSTPEKVREEVDHVLDRMLIRPEWFDAYIERPLDFKQIPTALTDQQNQSALALVPQHEVDDARLTSQATVAIEMINARLRSHEDPRTVVPSVLRITFCGDYAIDRLDRVPHRVSREDEWLADQLENDTTASRITTAVMNIVNERTHVRVR